MSTYTQTFWTNGSGNPISAANLTKIEDGINSSHSELQDHLDDTLDAHDASAISNVAAGNIVATTVQAALNELDTEKLALAGGTMTGALSITSSDAANSTALTITQQDTASALGVSITNAGTGDSFFVTQTGNGVALHIDNNGSANSLTVEGTTATDFTVSKAGNVNIAGSVTAGSYVGLPTNIYLGAEAAYLPATNPAAFVEVAGATTYSGWSYLAFDKTTSECAVWRVPLPGYNGGNITVTSYAKVQTTPAGNVTGQFNILTIGIATGEEFDSAVVADTNVNLSHAFTTSTHEHHIVIATATIDPANVATDDLLVIELDRDVTTDDLDSDLQLIGIMLTYTKS